MIPLRFTSSLLALFVCLVSLTKLSAQTDKKSGDALSESPRLRECFDRDWRFLLGDDEKAIEQSFDDSAWRELDLPHDWSVEGPFDKENPSGAKGGYLPCGTGWYRKGFQLPKSSEGRLVSIEFDGIYMNGEVWINGHRLGKRPYGYIGVEYDLTPFLNWSGENTVAVRVDNSLQPSSRWYTGSGIYRHVWLKTTDKLRVPQWGTQVWASKIAKEAAEVSMVTTLRNGYEAEKRVEVTQRAVDASGKEVASVTKEISIKAGGEQALPQLLTIEKPALWSPDSPTLYAVHTEVREGDVLLDEYVTPLGLREVVFDANKGMFLNGESIIMKGMCNHHDLGPLGAALWDGALERRLRMLKEMGCNSIRTAHNPSSPELLHLCDSMGFLVIDETFDEWRRGWAVEDGKLVASKGPKGKAKYGYHLLFDEWAEQDLTDHLMRDRNHPCVIMWSVGNEVPEAQKYGELETLKWLQELCHKLDPTRLVTVGCNFIQGANESGFASGMDITGYNGGGGSCFQYEADHAQFPERLMYASEVPHSFQTRGEYRTHSRYREKEHQPENLTEEEVFTETHPKYESSYDNAGVRISAQDSWRLTKSLPFLAGEFRWTGFDYLGESGGWPRVLGNFGIIDLCNFPKDTYYFYQSQWTEKAMVHLLPHWTWSGKEGTAIPVWCYTNCESVELFLNGESLGKREFDEENDMHLEWMVPYEPGELKAVAMRNGVEVSTDIERTAGPAAQVVLEADQTELSQENRDLSFVRIQIEDEKGTFVPKAAVALKLAIEGPGKIIAVGNGDPMSHASFQGNELTTFNGLGRVIIAPTGEKGEIVLTVTAEGLPQAEVRIAAEGAH